MNENVTTNSDGATFLPGTGWVQREQPQRDDEHPDPCCASGWVYNADGDVYPCPNCRPAQYRDLAGVSNGTQRRDLE